MSTLLCDQELLALDRCLDKAATKARIALNGIPDDASADQIANAIGWAIDGPDMIDERIAQIPVNTKGGCTVKLKAIAWLCGNTRRRELSR